MPSFDARATPDSALFSGQIRERCTAQRGRLAAIGRGKGQQVRVERHAADKTTLIDLALYTVADVHDGDPDAVAVGFRAPESNHHDLRDRLDLQDTQPFSCRINSVVPDPALPDDQVEARSEFVERLRHNGHHTGLIAIAPHGGNIERHTDEQAERVGERLARQCVSVWLCRGYKDGGGAFDRWHITSTDISEDSFPKLGSVMVGRRFRYAVAFHGWEHDAICIGGSAPDTLKRRIKEAIVSATAGSGIHVATDDEGTCPEEFNGTDPRNIVNRLGVHGVQIEQSIDARKRFGMQIAEAVADVLRPRFEVCTAPAFGGSSASMCLVKRLVYALAILPLLPLAWIPSIACRIRRLRFRIRACRAGNDDPCVEL